MSPNMLNRIMNKLSKQELEEVTALADEDLKTIKKSIQIDPSHDNNSDEDLIPMIDTLKINVAEEKAKDMGNEMIAVKQDHTANVIQKVDNILSPCLHTTPIPLTLPNDFDTRHPYRLGWPLLPSLPVHTSRVQVPRMLSNKSLHLNAIRQILATQKIKIHSETEVEIVHRFNAGKQLGKRSLTLLVPSSIDTKETWNSAVRALRSYIEEQNLGISIEIVDYRIVKGMYTLPILSRDPIEAVVKKRKHGVKKVLNESGDEWTSLEFFYRGHGPTRGDCKPTVLIGVPCPDKALWWEEKTSRIKEKVQGKMEVEIVWREVVKC